MTPNDMLWFYVLMFVISLCNAAVVWSDPYANRGWCVFMAFLLSVQIFLLFAFGFDHT